MIQAESLSLLRGSQQLLKDAQFTIFPGQRVGLVGANGTGKSSLFALLSGEIKEDSGSCIVPQGWRLATVAQETPALATPALQHVIEGDREYVAIKRLLMQAEAENNGTEIARLHGIIDAIGGYQIEARAAELLAGLGFTPEQVYSPVKEFSGGWRMRLNLAQALIARADLLLLDEPTNHLDLDTIIWLEQWLKRFPGTVIIISHDRDFLDGVAEHIIHIEYQTTHSYKGNYSSFQRQRTEKRRLQQQTYAKEQQQRAHLQKFVDRFRAKANKAKQAQSRLKALEKLTATAPLSEQSAYDLSFFEPEKLPNPLIQLDQVQAGYGDVTILEKIQLNLVPGSRIGLLGRNGAGKSTLTKLLAGDLAPQKGVREVSSGLRIGYFTQHQVDALSLKDHAAQHIQRLNPKASEQSIRDYLGRFGFAGDRAFEPVEPFSGGEKARLVLAMLIYQKPNLLLLDEPTNHLDLDMREALVEALQEFTGAMVVVSHDRHFLRTTVDDYYLVDHGEVQPFKGDLDDYACWLDAQQAEALKALSEKATNLSDQTQSTASSANKKEQRQAAAEKRKKEKPLRDRLRQVDKDMERCSGTLETLNAELGDPEVYEKLTNEQMTERFKQQAELQSSLEALEMEWLELQEKLQ